MARQITTGHLEFGAGNVAETHTWGTVAVLIKRDAVAGPAWMCPIYSGDGTAGNWGMSIDLNTGNVAWWSVGGGGSTELTDAQTLNSTSVWYLIVVTKASGSVVPVFHYRVQTAGTWGSWVHNNGSGAVANGSDDPVSEVWLGEFGGGFDSFDGVFAAAGIYHGWAPNNAAVEAAGFDVSGQKWVDAVPSATLGAWVVVPGSTATGSPIQDLGGGGGHETTSGVGAVVAGPTSWSETIGGGGTAHTRTITDPLGLLDSRSSRQLKVLTDNLGGLDSLARVAPAVRTISDALGLLDSLSIPSACPFGELLDHNGLPILDSNGQPLCASGAGGTAWTRTITDGLGLTDQLLRVAAARRQLDDALGLLDTVTRTAAARRELSDPLGLLDSVNRTATSRRTLTDPLGLLDTLNRTSAVRRTVTDPLGLLDSMATVSTLRRTIADGLGLTDSLTPASSYQRTLTDPLGLVDTLEARRLLLVVLTDSLGLADELNRRAVYGRTLTDGVGSTDSIGGEQAAARAIVDPLDLDDTLTRLVDYGRTIDDALGATDSTTWVHHQRRVIVDLLGLVDQISYNLAGAGQVSMSDPLGLTDALLRVVAARRSQTDSLGLTDVLSAAVRRVREITDAVSITDTLTRVAASSRTVDDNLGLTDSLVAQITTSLIQRTITDGLQLTDSLTVVQQLRRVLVDELGLTDSIDVADAVRLYAAAAGLVLRAWQAGALQRRAFTAGQPIRQFAAHLGG